MNVYSDDRWHTWLGQVVDVLSWAAMQAHSHTTALCAFAEDPSAGPLYTGGHDWCGGQVAPLVYSNTRPCQCACHAEVGK